MREMIECSNLVSQEIIAARDEVKEEFNNLRAESRSDERLPNIEECITYLAETIKVNSLELFINYINWAAELFKSRSYSIQELKKDLKVLLDILTERFAGDKEEVIKEYLTAALGELTIERKEIKSFLKEDNPYYELAVDYLDLLLNAEKQDAYQLIHQSVKDGVEIKDIYLHVFEPVQKEIGRLWQKNELSVATEHYCTSVTQLIMARLYPYILNSKTAGYQAVTTCVGNELHELGVRMIADLLEMEGWNTFHVGANAPKEDLINTVIAREVDLVCISVTMGNHLDEVTRLIADLRARDKFQAEIMVGGYPFNVNPELWQEVGADGYAPNAEESVRVAQELV